MNQFKVFSKLLAVVLATFGLAACSSDGPDGGKNSSLKMNKLNLDNAKYLTLGESSGSRANSSESLFKVDADGNTSVVMLECVEQEDGSTKTFTYNLEVMPAEVFSLSKSWMFLRHCSFYCADNEDIGWKLANQYNEPAGSYDFNILANKKTGKVYYVPDAQELYFFSYYFDQGGISNYFAEDASGNLYTTTEPNIGLSKVTVTSEGAAITKLGPSSRAFQGKPFVMPNGNIITISLDPSSGLPYSNSFDVVYPNGGFETYQSDYNAEEGYVTILNDVIYRVIILKDSEKRELQLQTISVGNAHGSISVSEPKLTCELKESLYVWWYQPLYISDRFIIFGTELAYDKQLGTWMENEWLENPGFITPTESNVYQGKAYSVWETGAAWMDLNTLENGYINFDVPGNLSFDKFQANIPGGECFVYVTDPVDGMSYVYRVDITNGNSTRSEVAYESATIMLIPLN